MNIIDVIVLLTIVFSGLIGMKKGFVKSLVSFLGIIIVFILSFSMKDKIADWMCLNLPFFNFSGDFKGATILNVIIYQTVAFMAIFSILMAVYHLIVRISGLAEWLLKISIIGIIPTKIGGLIVGLLKGILISLIAIVILSLPTLKLGFIDGTKLVKDSTIRNYLYNSSPVVGNVTKDLNNSVEEILELKDKFDNKETKEDFNLSSLDIMLKHKVIKTTLAEKLVNSGKLKIDEEKAKEIINKYK